MSEFRSHEAAARSTAALPIAPPARLIGRDAVIREVYPKLKAGQAVLLHGAAGIGKTAIAATIANGFAQQPGGTLWLDTQGDALEGLLVRVGRAYGVPEIMNADNPLGMLGAVATLLAQHKPLIVLDGHMDPQVATRFITRCADRLPVLLVSRQAIDGPWESAPVGPLDTADAVTLYKQESGLNDDSQDADIARIAQTLHGQPFALGIAARTMFVSKKSAAQFADGLAQIAPTAGGNPAQTAITTALATLNGAMQGLALIMGATFSGQAGPDLLAMVSGAPPETVVQAMRTLVGLHLVEQLNRYGTPHYRLHAITRAVMIDRLRSSGKLEELEGKVLRSLLAYVQQYSQGSADALYDRLAVEMENLVSAASYARRHDQRDWITQMVALLRSGDFVQARGYSYELNLIRESGGGGGAAFPANPTPQESVAPEDAAPDLFSMLDSMDEEIDEGFDDVPYEADDDEEEDLPAEDSADLPAEPLDEMTRLRQQVTEARASRDSRAEAAALSQIGARLLAEKRDTEAIVTLSEALTAYEAHNDQPGVLKTLVTLSELTRRTGNPQAAQLHAGRGVKLAEDLADAPTRLQLLLTLGDIRQDLGESPEAVVAYTSALSLARERQDTAHEALALYKLGYAQLDEGSAETAVQNWEQARALFKAQGKREYEGKVLGGLGSAMGELNRWAEAINFHSSALYIAREVGDREDEALQLSSLAYACVQGNQLPAAVTHYRQALHLAYAADDRANIVSLVVDLVRLLLRAPAYLDICALLVDDALTLDPADKDLTKLKERITNEKMLAQAQGTAFKPVHGTARTYAENAYKLLD